MKRAVSLLLSLLMIISVITCVPVTASAASKSDLTFQLDWFGNDAYVVVACKTSASGELVIPDTYNGKPVIGISSYAFNGCKKLTSIIIGENVKDIEYAAFYNCTKLSTVRVSASVEYIDSAAFHDCSNLESIKVSKNNKNYSASKGVLFNKDKTTIVKYPQNKTATSYTVPDTVKSIGSEAFSGNKNIETITIPDSVTSLGSYIFDGCTNLEKVKIGKGVNISYYSSWIFGECKNLKSVTFSKQNPNHSSSNGVVFNKDKTELIMYPTGKIGDTYKIPNTVETIGCAAFSKCIKLKSVVIPGSVKKISNDAFYNCTNLKSVTMADSVKEIGSCAFKGCKKLTKADISNSVTDIAYGVFADCSSLTKVAIPNSVKSMGWDTFSGCEDLVSVSLGTGLTEIQWETFEGCTSLKSIIIPHNIKTIQGYAFEGCTNLKSYKIPCTVKEIGEKAFGYSFDYEKEEYTKIKGAKVYGEKGSEAQTYAKDNSISFVAVTDPGKTKIKTIKNTSYGVKLTWSEVEKAEYYEIYRKVKDGKLKYIGRTTKESYTDKTAKSGKKYYYKVRSVNAAGKSDFTSAKSILFLDTPTLKTPSSIKSGISLKWSKVTGAQGYVIYRKTGSGSYKKLKTEKGVSNLSYTDKTAKKGKTYTYKVKAYNSKTYSAFSNTKKIKDKY